MTAAELKEKKNKKNERNMINNEAENEGRRNQRLLEAGLTKAYGRLNPMPSIYTLHTQRDMRVKDRIAVVHRRPVFGYIAMRFAFSNVLAFSPLRRCFMHNVHSYVSTCMCTETNLSSSSTSCCPFHTDSWRAKHAKSKLCCSWTNFIVVSS